MAGYDPGVGAWYGEGAAASGQAAAAEQSGATNKNLKDYGSWNGDFEGYLRYMAQHGSDADYDRWVDYMMSETSAANARDWTAKREDSQYQRLVADLKAAGINPYVLMNSGGQPVSSSSSGISYSGAYSSNESLKKEANSQKWASIFASLISTLVIAAVMMA